MNIRLRARDREAQITFDTFTLEGALLSPHALLRIARRRAGQQTERDYRVTAGLDLRDEIGRCWRIALARWNHFAAAPSHHGEHDARAHHFVPTLLREAFGFTSLQATEVRTRDGRASCVHLAALGGKVPVMVAPVGCGLDTLTDAPGDDGTRRSAFGLTQEALDHHDNALWGIVSDGVTLRVVRRSVQLACPAFIEVDLARLFREARAADFETLWLLLHETRFGTATSLPRDCALESWRTADRETRARACDHLRRGLEGALRALGQGFLSHPENHTLRNAVQTGALTPDGYLQELLRLCYRVIFAWTIEAREALHAPSSNTVARVMHHDTDGCANDLWALLRGLAQGDAPHVLSASKALLATMPCLHLDTATIENDVLARAASYLAGFDDEGGVAPWRWCDMSPEEQGSVYESLLELVPHFSDAGRTFGLVDAEGSAAHTRRKLGSYFTPEALVEAVLRRALDPVVAEVVHAHGDAGAEALLSLSIVDPACGSGHFLLPAARRLAMHVARVEANGTPSASQYRHALRRVVQRCIYGIDLNAMALELCRVGLWMEAQDPGLSLSSLDARLRHGNALFGATPTWIEGGVPDAAWCALEGDDKAVASALKRRNQRSAKVAPSHTASRSRENEEQHEVFIADAWCAAFVWPKVAGASADAAPTNERFAAMRDDPGQVPEATRHIVNALARQYHFLHWHLAFPQVFARGGFDVVLGNPPWIAHAGRASQPLPRGMKQYLACKHEAFAAYPTTHGAFVGFLPQCLRLGGRLGVVVPSSVSELGGYEPTRRAHDRWCEIPDALIDFGEGRFEGVTQPCMALVSRRTTGGRRSASPGDPWPMERPELTAIDRALLARLASMPRLPPVLFGERGLQSDTNLAAHFTVSPKPTERFTTPIREGADVREFELRAPRNHVDAVALGARLRSAKEFAAVRIVVRQTARYPIAALSDGVAFRNSLLAVFEDDDWPAEALVALLNSALIRWTHYQRFRDARQPAMPQVKVGHLREIPAPVGWQPSDAATFAALGGALTRTGDPAERTRLRATLDEVTAQRYGLSASERDAVACWHVRYGPSERS